MPLRDAPSRALSIRLLIDNPCLARRFGKQACRKVKPEFEVPLVNQSTLEQYEQLLATPLQRKPFLAGWF